MNKFYFTALMMIGFIGTAHSQTVINLTSDLVLTETLVITESTTYVGNLNKIICTGCDPMIRVEGEIEVRFEDVIFDKSYESWLSNLRGAVYWDGPKMRGKMVWDNVD